MAHAHRMTHSIVTGVVFCGMLALLLPGASGAEDDRQGAKQHLETHREEQRIDNADETRWRAEHESVNAAVEEAQARLDRALAAYSRSHASRRVRGDKRGQIAEERDAAEAALAEAKASRERFLEKAHRAGVPPGWLRPKTPKGSEAEVDPQ